MKPLDGIPPPQGDSSSVEELFGAVYRYARVYGARYSATRHVFSTTALHLLHVRRGFCTLVLFIMFVNHFYC